MTGNAKRKLRNSNCNRLLPSWNATFSALIQRWSQIKMAHLDPHNAAVLRRELQRCSILHRVFEHPSKDRFPWRKDRKLLQICDLVLLQMLIQKQEIGRCFHWRWQLAFPLTANHYAIRQCSFSKLQSFPVRWSFPCWGYYDAASFFAGPVANFPTFSKP